jgi:hypothetical protein
MNVNEAAITSTVLRLGVAGGLGDAGIRGAADARMALLDVMKDLTRADLRREVESLGLNPGDCATNAALKEAIVKSLYATGLPPDAAIEKLLV